MNYTDRNYFRVQRPSPSGVLASMVVAFDVVLLQDGMVGGCVKLCLLYMFKLSI